MGVIQIEIEYHFQVSDHLNFFLLEMKAIQSLESSYKVLFSLVFFLHTIILSNLIFCEALCL